MNTLSETRSSILSRMVVNAPNQELGRTKVMRLFYFLQELKGVPLGYDFRLFTYGPFQSEVLSDLSSACSAGAVNEQTKIYPRGYGYLITPGTHAERLSRELENNDRELSTKVDEVVQEFGSFNAAELELLSTISFVDREWKQAGTMTAEEQLVDRVHEIKPHFTKPTILERVREMVTKGWLTVFNP